VPFIVGVSLRQEHLPLATFERLALDGERQSKLLGFLLGCPTVSEAVVISTCQRTEVVAVVDRYHTGVEQIRNALADVGEIDVMVLAEAMTVTVDESAMRHVFRVSAGADSAVLGEVEILGQVQSGWQLARNEGATGVLLDALFGAAVALGRKVRATTLFSRGPTSLSFVAADLAVERSDHDGPLEVMVVGAGDMARGVIKSLPSDANVTVVNRTQASAEQMIIDLRDAQDKGSRQFASVRYVSVDQATRLLQDGVDAIVSTVPIVLDWIEPDVLSKGANARSGRASAIVDLAVPRSIVLDRHVDGVEVLDIEAVTEYVSRTYRDRQQHLPVVLQEVELAIETFLHGIDEREVEPLIKELIGHADSIRQQQLAKNEALLDSLPDAARAQVESMMRAFEAKLMHEPLAQLRERSGTDHGRRMANELRKAFDL
jgi:glutamyl-tRNA reductase